MRRTRIEIAESTNGRFVNIRIVVVGRDKEGNEKEHFLFIPEEDVEEFFSQATASTILEAWGPVHKTKMDLRVEERRIAKQEARRGVKPLPKVGTHINNPGKTEREREAGKLARHNENQAAKAEANRRASLGGGSGKAGK